MRYAAAAYTQARCIAWKQFSAKAVYTRQGIVAGCSLATSLVKVFVVQPMDAVISILPPAVGVDMYIDDVSVHALGSEAALRRDVGDAVAMIRDTLQTEVGPVSWEKAGLVSSSALVGRLLQRRFPGFLGSLPPSPFKLLGTDVRAGLVRATIGKGTKAARAKVAKRRWRKGLFLRSMGATSPVKLFTAGLRPAQTYGFEVYGADNASIDDLEKQAAGLATRSPCGASRSAAVLLHSDPLGSVRRAALLRWAREVWAAVGREGPPKLLPAAVGGGMERG